MKCFIVVALCCILNIVLGCDSRMSCLMDIMKDTQRKNLLRDQLIKHELQVHKMKLWDILHRMSLEYPAMATEDEVEYMLEKLNQFSYMLPCPACANDMREQVAKIVNSEVLKSRDSFIVWVCEYHNHVKDRKSTRLNSSHSQQSRMPSSA